MIDHECSRWVVNQFFANTLGSLRALGYPHCVFKSTVAAMATYLLAAADLEVVVRAFDGGILAVPVVLRHGAADDERIQLSGCKSERHKNGERKARAVAVQHIACRNVIDTGIDSLDQSITFTYSVR